MQIVPITRVLSPTKVDRRRLPQDAEFVAIQHKDVLKYQFPEKKIERLLDIKV